MAGRRAASTSSCPGIGRPRKAPERQAARRRVSTRRLQMMGLLLGGALVEVVGPEVLVDGAVAQDVPDGGQHRGGDGADRLLRAAALAQALELRPEIAVLPAAGGPGALDEGGLQPGRALAQPRGAALARALVVAGAEASPPLDALRH